MDVIRQRLHFALDAARMSVWDSTLVDGSVAASLIDWSADASALLGLARKQCRMPFIDYLAFILPDDRAATISQMQTHVDRFLDFETSYRIRRADGPERWLRAKARILGAAGTPTGTLGLIWDDTERKERELATHEGRMRGRLARR